LLLLDHWGDYARVRTLYPSTNQWIAAGYGITGTCSDPNDCVVTAKAVIWSDVATPVAPVGMYFSDCLGLLAHCLC